MGCAPGTVIGGATGLVSGNGELAGTEMGVVRGTDTGVAAGLDGVTVTGLVAGTVMIVGVEVSGVVGKIVVGELVMSCIVLRSRSVSFRFRPSSHLNSMEAFSSTSKYDPTNLPAKMTKAFRNRTEMKQKTDSPNAKQQNPLKFLLKQKTQFAKEKNENFRLRSCNLQEPRPNQSRKRGTELDLFWFDEEKLLTRRADG